MVDKTMLRRAIDEVCYDKGLMIYLFKESSCFLEDMTGQITYHLKHNPYFKSKVKGELKTSDLAYVFLLVTNKDGVIYREPTFVSADIVNVFISEGWINEMDGLTKAAVAKVFKQHANQIGKRFFEYSFYLDLKVLENLIVEYHL